MYFLFFISLKADTPKKWTSLVYINYDNHNKTWYNPLIRLIGNLSAHPSVNTVIQGDDGTASRLLLTKNGLTQVQELGEVNSGSAQTLEDFLTWAITKYPAERYMLTIVTINVGGAFSGDATSEEKLSYLDFAKTLKKVGRTLPNRKFDVLNMLLPTLGFFSGYIVDVPFLLELDEAVDIFLGTDDNIGTLQTQIVLPSMLNTLNDSPSRTNKNQAHAMMDSFKVMGYPTRYSAVVLKNVKPFAVALEKVSTKVLAYRETDSAFTTCTNRSRGYHKVVDELLTKIDQCADGKVDLLKALEEASTLLGYRTFELAEGEKESIATIKRRQPGKVIYQLSPTSPTQEVDLVLDSEQRYYQTTLTLNNLSRWSFFVKYKKSHEAKVFNQYKHFKTDFPTQSPLLSNLATDFVMPNHVGGGIIFNAYARWYDEMDQMKFWTLTPNTIKFLNR